jgi:hypothetical protein
MTHLRRTLAPAAALAAILVLGGCSAAAKFTAADMQTAASLANTPSTPATAAAANAIDPQGYNCWGTMAPAMTAISNGQDPGLATLIEAARVLVLAAKSGGACGALAQPIMAQLALLPGAANIIAEAATTVQ